MKNQVFNPYLPLNEYVPDGEPHVFGERVYVFGSHDKESGETFCMLDYVCYSAPVNDLSDWKYEGIIYKKTQDPMNKDGAHALYAPDVCQGLDGRYYLYYGLDFLNLISVAVCDTPAGKYEFLGTVQHKNGEFLRENLPFDPAVINDDGRIFLYYGFAPTMFKIPGIPEDLHMPGGSVVELESDMLTIKSGPLEIIPSTLFSNGTGFEGHEYFEAPSIRKINDLYYLVYSSVLSHELCYCTSKYPDKDFIYGGIIISNGDVGLSGRKTEDTVAVLGNNHGGLVCINEQWYIFYHRHTHGNAFSRQGCAEPIKIEADGKINQVEITSCGLNMKPLVGKGEYPAIICCTLTNGKMPNHTMPKGNEHFPFITNVDEERFIKGVDQSSLIGYKYFDLADTKKITIKYRGEGKGNLNIFGKDMNIIIATIKLDSNKDWKEETVDVEFTKGPQPLYFKYQGEGVIDILSFRLDTKL